MDSLDGATHVRVGGRIAPALPSSSIFRSLEEVSAFFKGGSVGYSATSDRGRFDGLELRTLTWNMAPFEVNEIASSFFEDALRFSPGNATFDSALVMRAIEHEWRACAPICSAA